MGWTIERSKSDRASCHKCGSNITDPIRLCRTTNVSKRGQYMSNKDYFHVTCAGMSLDSVMKVYGWEGLGVTSKEWVKSRMGRR